MLGMFTLSPSGFGRRRFEFFAGAMHALLDGAGGSAEHLAGLGAAQALHLHQHVGRPQALRQRRELVLEHALERTPERRRLRVRAAASGVQLEPLTRGGVLWAAAAMAHAVDGGGTRDGERPREDAAP